MGISEPALSVVKLREADNDKPANVTCQTAASFSVPSSPLQHEILIILLGDPQFKRVFQQNLFRFEPHVSNANGVICQMHLTCHAYPQRTATSNPWTFVCVRTLPSHVDKKNCQRCKALWDCSFWGKGGPREFFQYSICFRNKIG